MGSMALSLLQREQLLLKHRVVEIQPDAASGLITAKARQGFILLGIRWWVSGGPGHRSLQGCRGSGFV